MTSWLAMKRAAEDTFLERAIESQESLLSVVYVVFDKQKSGGSGSKVMALLGMAVDPEMPHWECR
jgi:hypothetical protein